MDDPAPWKLRVAQTLALPTPFDHLDALIVEGQEFYALAHTHKRMQQLEDIESTRVLIFQECLKRCAAGAFTHEQSLHLLERIAPNRKKKRAKFACQAE